MQSRDHYYLACALAKIPSGVALTVNEIAAVAGTTPMAVRFWVNDLKPAGRGPMRYMLGQVLDVCPEHARKRILEQCGGRSNLAEASR